MLQIPQDNAEPLPILYGQWLAEFLDVMPPQEHRANCANCSMASGDGVRHPTRAPVFLEAVKCCTYLPKLPNYLVGCILASDSVSADGKISVVERIDRMVGVSPLGLNSTPVYDLIYQQSGTGFGTMGAMRCPHYLDASGGCGIWQYRNSVCSTWFCKHVRGKIGADMWQAVRRLLVRVEQDLSIWAAVEVGAPIDAIVKILDQGPERRASDLVGELAGSNTQWIGASVWGEWLANEKEFFVACGRKVTSLGWDQVVAICGPEVGLLMAEVRNRVAVTTAPRSSGNTRSTMLGDCRILHEPDGAVWLCAYSPYDWVKVELGAWQALSLREERNSFALGANHPHVPQDVLDSLSDFGILIAS